MRLIDADALIEKYPSHQSLCDKVDRMPTIESTNYEKGYQDAIKNLEKAYDLVYECNKCDNKEAGCMGCKHAYVLNCVYHPEDWL